MKPLYSRWLPGAAAGLAVLLAAALYFGPHWTVSRMRAAVEARDPYTLSDYIDFPSLRESFKAQLLLKVNEKANGPGMRGNPFAALGQMLVLNIINPMVDTLVTPAGVMVMLQEGKPKVTPAGLIEQATVQPPQPAASAPAPTAAPVPKYKISYVNWSTAEIQATESTQAADTGPQKFILRRQGLFSWKLAAVEMAL